MNKKIIVSNRRALKALYGEGNLKNIEAALNTLEGADQRRCIQTTVVYIDDTDHMQAMGLQPVTNATDDKQNKDAIDGVYKAQMPEYLTILGSPDIIPQQIMDNPVQGAYEDPNVPSDLPYASNASYSKTIADFTSPNRVVGRLTGIKGNNDPAILLQAINTSASLEKRTRDEYDNYFAVSAKVWQGSSATSTKNIFGNSTALHLSPPDGPNWSDNDLMAKAHFVNCHGGDNDPNWYGQDGSTYPKAVEASQIKGKIIPGTIAAAECCYGAQLYPGWGVCISYIAGSCAAFCGSSTIAYGPATGQGQADLITQYFLIFLLAGASAGSALLAARQKYIRECNPLNAVDLKTLGQFSLLGDSSSHPVGIAKADTAKIAAVFSDDNHQIAMCREKRQRFMIEAEALKQSTGIAVSDPQATPSEEITRTLDQVTERYALKDIIKESYRIEGGAHFAAAQKAIAGPEHIHMVTGFIDKFNERIYNAVVIIVKEMQGNVSSVEILHTK